MNLFGLEALFGEGRIERLGLDHDVGFAGQLACQKATHVAHGFGQDMLVRLRVLEHRVDVDAAFVRKSAFAHVRLVVLDDEIRDLADVMRRFGQVLQVGRLDAVEAHLELEIRDERDQIRVAATLAETVDRPLHVPRAGLDCRQRIGDAGARIVVGVDAQRRVDQTRDFARDAGDFGRQRAAVGVAQHERACPGGVCRAQRLERVLGIRLVTVEKMFRVVHNRTVLGA